MRRLPSQGRRPEGDQVRRPFGGSLPLSIVTDTLGTRAIVVSIANHDDNQHAANENLRLRNLWEGIDMYVALLMHRELPAGVRSSATSK